MFRVQGLGLRVKGPKCTRAPSLVPGFFCPTSPPRQIRPKSPSSGPVLSNCQKEFVIDFCGQWRETVDPQHGLSGTEIDRNGGNVMVRWGATLKTWLFGSLQCHRHPSSAAGFHRYPRMMTVINFNDTPDALWRTRIRAPPWQAPPWTRSSHKSCSDASTTSGGNRFDITWSVRSPGGNVPMVVFQLRIAVPSPLCNRCVLRRLLGPGFSCFSHLHASSRHTSDKWLPRSSGFGRFSCRHSPSTCQIDHLRSTLFQFRADFHTRWSPKFIALWNST